METGTIQGRLCTIAARVRERAIRTRTFDAEVAADLEDLASIAARIETIMQELDDAIGDLEAVTP